MNAITRATQTLAFVRDRLLMAMGALEREDYDQALAELNRGAESLRALVEELRAA